MEIGFQYSFGGIKEISGGKCEKFGSLDDLDFSVKSSVIIVPKIIGIYQFNRDLPEDIREVRGLVENDMIYLSFGKKENLDSGLICVAYDPTNLNQELIRRTIEDLSGRVKITEYHDLPNFEEKSTWNFIADIDFHPFGTFSQAKIPLLEKEIETYEMARREFGLTRNEASRLEALKALERKNHRSTISLID